MICACGDKILFTASGQELRTLLEKTRHIKVRWISEGANLISDAYADWEAYQARCAEPVEYYNPLPEALNKWEALPWYVRLTKRKPTAESHPQVPMKKPDRVYPSQQTYAVMRFDSSLSELLKELDSLDIYNATLVRKGTMGSPELLPHQILSVNHYLPFHELIKALNVKAKYPERNA